MDDGVNLKPTLEELARECFSDLSDAELKLLRSAPRGLPARCGDLRAGADAPINNPSHADAWPERERDIRGDLVRWLSVDPEARSRINPAGIRVESARILGDLALSFLILPFPLAFVRCKFLGTLRLVQADLRRLELSASKITGVIADQAHVRGSVLLNDGFGSEEEVRLCGAIIGGNLDCRNGNFTNEQAVAINAEGAKINGTAFLGDRFSAKGEVRLSGAYIRGTLSCDKGSFKNQKGTALSAIGAKIGRNVSLRNEFRAEGEVTLYGASIGGDLECSDGSFNNCTTGTGQAIALRVSRANISGSVNLRDGFSAQGEVRLYGATIGGDLICEDGSFKNFEGVALAAGRTTIGGSVNLRNGFRSEGEVNLHGASIGGDLECTDGSFNNFRQGGLGGTALTAARANIEGSVHLHDGFSAKGQVRLYGATIGGDLECTKGRFENAEAFALRAGRAKINGAVVLREGFDAEGEVSLYGASIAGDLQCDNSSFRNLGKMALNAGLAQVGGTVFLRGRRGPEGEMGRFRAEGEVSLYGTTISGNFSCVNGTFENPGKIALNLGLANIERAAFLADDFAANGEVSFRGATVAGDLDVSRANLKGAHLDLRRVRAGTLRSKDTTWPEKGNLLLDGFVYERLAEGPEGPSDAKHCLHWLDRQHPGENVYSFSPQPYRRLAGVLREQGQDAQARKILIGLEDDRRKYGHLTLGRVWACVLKWTIAYGYRPLQALLWVGAFVFLGFVVFGSAYRSGELVPSDKDAYESFTGTQTGRSPEITVVAILAASGGAAMPEQKAPNASGTAGQLPGSYEGFCAFVYSFDTFVPIIDLSQRSRWKPIEAQGTEIKLTPPKPNDGNKFVCAICDPAALVHWCLPLPAWLVRFYRWIHIVAGWFFTVLFGAGISGLVRRD